MNSLKKYMSLQGQEKKYFLEALIYLYLAKLILWFLPLKKIVHTDTELKYNVVKANEEMLVQIKTAVARADRLAFWKNRCIVKSLAARLMLQRRRIPSQLSLGVAFDTNKKLMAHAWINAENIEIVPRIPNYNELIVIH